MEKKQVYEEFDVLKFKVIEQNIIDKYMRELVQMVMDHSTIISLLYVDKKFKSKEHSSETMADLKTIIGEIVVAMRQFNELATDKEKWIQKLGPKYVTHVERYSIVAKFLNEVMEMLGVATRIEKLISKKVDKDTFLMSVNSMNKKIDEVMTRAILPLKNVESSGFNIDECFEMLDCFVIDIEGMDFSEIIAEKKAEQDKITVQPQRKSVPVQISEKEQARLNRIQEANDLYARFQEDFMRDLVKEVSMMNKDLYDALIDKVEKFLKRFPMPLSNGVSIGMANEAYSQINKFIEAVYDISRNTYTPIVFSK